MLGPTSLRPDAGQQQHCVGGVHVNGPLSFATQIDDDTLAAMTDLDRDRAARTQAFMRDEYGYIAIQSTRPGLIGAALTDSPAAQLAWMLDKLHAWTYPADALPDTVLGREWILAILADLHGRLGRLCRLRPGWRLGCSARQLGRADGRNPIRPRRRHPLPIKRREHDRQLDRHRRSRRTLRRPRRTRHPP
jgi:hypothetical protein